MIVDFEEVLLAVEDPAVDPCVVVGVRLEVEEIVDEVAILEDPAVDPCVVVSVL